MRQYKLIFIALVLTFVSATLQAARVDTLGLTRVEHKFEGKVKKVGNVEFKLAIDAITGGNNKLNRNVSSWINAQLSASIGDGAYTKDTIDKEMASFYEKLFFKNTKKDILSYVKETKSVNRKAQNYTLDIKVNKVYETSGLVTFKIETYDYIQGEGGNQTDMYASFCKSDGRQLTWNDIAQKQNQEKLSAMLSEEIKSFLGTPKTAMPSSRTKKKKKAKAANLSLPSSMPGIIGEGLKAFYAQGEFHPDFQATLTVNMDRLKAILPQNTKILLR